LGEDPEVLTNWSGLWDESLNGKVTIKDSIRDTYFIALAKVYEKELLDCKQKFIDSEYATAEDPTGVEAYNKAVTEIVNRSDYESVTAVEKELAILKSNLFGFEVDAGKSDILTGKIDVNLAWSGDAVYSIYQGLFDDEGNDLENPVYLGYTIPEEGSNVWFDGYVMTKNADYDKAIQFLDFISRPDIAVLNMDYTGYTSCIAGDEVFEYVLDSYHDDESEYLVDLKYFFDPECETDDYVINVAEGLEHMFFAQYPTEDVINRCAIMKNFSGEELVRINDMWKKTKLVTLSDAEIYVILAVIVLFIVAVIVIKNREKLFTKKRFEGKEKKSKYKVVKREKLN
jgi:spermidine/putrescine transport system substrate-binding protein